MPKVLDKIQVVARLCKVDESKHEVWGIATEESPDVAGEILDYEGSKPLFQEWSSHAEEISGGKSKGNLRRMHQLDAIGKLVDIQFDDDSKRIKIGAKVTDPQSWTDVMEGVLPAFSIGGVYVKRKQDGDLIRYVCRPNEISLVDLPCLPTAVVEFIKADGSSEQRNLYKENRMAPEMSEFAKKLNNVWEDLQALKSEGKTKRVAGEDLSSSAFAFVGDKDDTSTWKLPIHFANEEKSKRHVRNALARFGQTQGIPEDEKPRVLARIKAAAKRYGIESSDDEGKKAQAELEFYKTKVFYPLSKSNKAIKSLQNIQDLTGILQTLRWVLMDAQWEADWEFDGAGDPRDEALAVEIRAAMEHIIEILKDTVDEETDELLPSIKALRPEPMDSEPVLAESVINQLAA